MSPKGLRASVERTRASDVRRQRKKGEAEGGGGERGVWEMGWGVERLAGVTGWGSI